MIVRIKRNKHFCGSLIPYVIVVNYDVKKFKEMINDNKSNKQNLRSLKYYFIKNGETVEVFDENIKSIFVCSNIESINRNIYPLVCSNQIEVTGNMNLTINTKFHWKNNELTLNETK